MLKCKIVIVVFSLLHSCILCVVEFINFYAICLTSSIVQNVQENERTEFATDCTIRDLQLTDIPWV